MKPNELDDFLRLNKMTGKAGIEAVCTANVIKYVWRYEEKNGVEDLRKSLWCLDRLIKEVVER